MARLIKLALAGVGVLFLLAILAAVAVYFLVDPEDYRGLIIETVEEQTGRTLKIEGELGLDLFPCCSIAVDGAELGNPEGFSGDYFARIKEVGIGLRVIPLILQRRIVMGELILVGLDLALEENASGAANWSFESGAEPETPTEGPEDGAMELESLSVAGVTIRDAAISYTTAGDGTAIRIDDLSLETNRIAPGEPFDIAGGFTATDVASEQTLQLNLDSSAAVAEDPLSISLSELVLDVLVAGVKIELTGGGSLSADGINLGGLLKVPEFSPQSVLKELGEEPIETADASVLKKVSAGGSWSLNSDRIAIEQLQLRLDDSVISGQMQNNYGGRGDTQFDVIIDDIDVDRYLAPEVESDGDAGDVAEDDSLPLDMLRSLDLRGTLAANSVKVSDLRLSDLKSTVSARNGRISLEPMSASLYGGQVSGLVALDASGKQARLSINQTMKGVQAVSLLTDFAEMDNIEGLMNARFTGTGRGNSTTALIESLTADVSFDLQDGLVKDMDIWHEIRRARALLRRKAPPPAPSPQQTEIKTMSLKGRIADSVFSSDQIVAEIPFLQLTGSGALGLIEQNLDFRFRAKVIETPVFEDGEDLEDLTGLSIPVDIEGTMDDPEIGVDLADLAKDAAVKEAKEKLFEKLFKDDETEEPADPDAPPKEEDAGDVLKRGLRDFLKN